MLTIGCHLSTKNGYLRMAEEAVSINANTFQYFTRNPRGGAAKALDPKDVEAYKGYASAHGIGALVAYAPYDVEPASSEANKRAFADLVLSEDLKRLEEIPGQFYLVRPGSADADTSEQAAIANVSEAFNRAIHSGQSTTVLVDTMAGEGHQVGGTFEQIAAILSGVTEKEKMGVCLDTSAVWAAGYDIVNDLDGVLAQFDQVIGLDRLKVVHLNDSKEPLGSHVDRHARIGEGHIGFDALAALVNDPRLADVAFILEEPESDLVIYEHDVARFQKAYRG